MTQKSKTIIPIYFMSTQILLPVLLSIWDIKMRIFHLIWIHRNRNKKECNFVSTIFDFIRKKKTKAKGKLWKNSKLRSLAASKIDIHLLFILLYSWIKNRKYDTWEREMPFDDDVEGHWIQSVVKFVDKKSLSIYQAL